MPTEQERGSLGTGADMRWDAGVAIGIVGLLVLLYFLLR